MDKNRKRQDSSDSVDVSRQCTDSSIGHVPTGTFFPLSWKGESAIMGASPEKSGWQNFVERDTQLTVRFDHQESGIRMCVSFLTPTTATSLENGMVGYKYNPPNDT
jgi:hypothetical protein